MKILIMSDSHGLRNIEEYRKFENADILIHAGDSQLMVEELSGFDYKVKGNCDYISNLESTIFFDILGKKFMLTHGNLFDSKSLIQYAKDNNCDVIIHGHTHIVRYDIVGGIMILNPGSLRSSRCKYPESYMVIDGDKIYLKDAKTLEIIEEYRWI